LRLVYPGDAPLRHLQNIGQRRRDHSLSKSNDAPNCLVPGAAGSELVSARWRSQAFGGINALAGATTAAISASDLERTGAAASSRWRAEWARVGYYTNSIRRLHGNCRMGFVPSIYFLNGTTCRSAVNLKRPLS